MRTVDDAYYEIAKNLLWFVDGNDWSFARARSSIWAESTQTGLARTFQGREVRDDRFPPTEMLTSCSGALLFLRDELLRTTGKRIWGLTFTLYPNGKFNIQYDYDRPDDYEETDETISGDKINASLSDLIGRGKANE